jgi:hypothetical protein
MLAIRTRARRTDLVRTLATFVWVNVVIGVMTAPVTYQAALSHRPGTPRARGAGLPSGHAAYGERLGKPGRHRSRV